MGKFCKNNKICLVSGAKVCTVKPVGPGTASLRVQNGLGKTPHSIHIYIDPNSCIKKQTCCDVFFVSVCEVLCRFAVH